MRPIALTLLALLAAPQALAQTTWYVDVLGPGPGTGTGTLVDPFTTIQAGIDATTTVDGDTLMVWAGAYRENVDLGGKSIAIRALFPELETIVDGGGTGRVITAASGEGPGTLVEGLILQNGRAAGGGGVLVDGASLDLVGCTIAGNSTPGDGGGVLVRGGGELELTQCEMIDNVARGAGGGVAGPASLVDCRLEGNFAVRGGGAFGARLVDCQLERNSAGSADLLGDGGGAYGSELLNCILDRNIASRSGGGAAHSTLRRGFVVFNRAQGILDGTTVSGGGLESCDAEQVRVTFNYCYGSGRIEGAGVARSTLRDSLIRSHVIYDSVVYGVGAYDSDLVRCEISGNQTFGAGSIGGGMFGGSAVDCLIQGNVVPTFSATPPPADPTTGSVGGGAFGARLLRCRVIQNAGRQGSGLFACDADRCTILGGGGGSIVAAAANDGAPGRPDRGRLSSCIVVPRVWQFPPTLPLVLQNGAVDVEFSFVEDGAPGIGNLSGDPLLVQAAFADVNLLPGSPCIDAGDPSAPLDPDGSRADMGAIPFDPSYCGGPFVFDCGFTGVEASGFLSAAGASDLTIRIPGLEPGVTAWPFVALASARRDVWPIGYVCVDGPLTQAAPLQVPASGTLEWAPDVALALGAGAVVGDRVYFQFYVAAGTGPQGPTRLSDMVETTLCP